MLICGKCPDSLSTVAQDLNRIRSEQLRLEILLHTKVSPPHLEKLNPIKP
jgi:hypothetical protein